MRFDRGPNSKLSPVLASWCLKPGSEGEREVSIRIGPSVDLGPAAAALSEQGARVNSVGAGVITANVSRPVIFRIAELSWVLAIEEQKRLFSAYVLDS